MKLEKLFLPALGILIAAYSLDASAQQTRITTKTNVVTVLVTNVVTVTNVVSAAPPEATPVLPPTNAVVKYPWESSISAGLTLTRGNSHSLLATIKFLTERKTPVNEFTFDADGAYGSANGVANSELVHGYGQWNHLFSDRWYSYLRGEALHDDISLIRYRVTLTAGVGYYVIKKADTTLGVEGGPGVVIQRVGSDDNTFATVRIAERFEHKFNKGGARIWESVEYLPQVDKPSDYLINAEIGVECALYKSLSLQVYLDDNYNSEPAAGSKRNDVKLVSGVSYKF